jgi:iron complex outermembrane recepter protein
MRKISLLLLLSICAVFVQPIAALPYKKPASQAPIDGAVSGLVKDVSGAPIIGASVLVVGTNLGTTTDANGYFQITVLSDRKVTLTVRAIGYRTLTQELADTKTNLVLTLTEDIANLDQVIVTGTATSRKQKEATGSLTQLSAKQLQSTSGFSQADVLRTIPGVHAENGGGEVASNIFVRGLPAGGQYKYTPIEEDGMPVQATGYLTSSAQDVYFRNDLGLQNMEFARGGSVALFGNGSPLGVFNNISKKGSATPETIIKITGATQGLARLDFNTSGPMGDKWRYNMSGFYRFDKGPIITGLTTQGFQVRGNVTRLLDKGFIRVYARILNDQDQFFLPVPHPVGTFEAAKGNDGEPITTLNTIYASAFNMVTPNGTISSTAGSGVYAKGSSFMFEFVNSFGNNWDVQAKVRLSNFAHRFDFFSPGKSYDLDTYTARFGTNGVYTYTDNGQPLALNTTSGLNSGKTWVTESNLTLRNRPLSDNSTDVRVTKKAGSENAEHNFTFGMFGSTTKQLQDEWGTGFLTEMNNAPRLVDLTVTDAAGKAVKVTKDGFRQSLGSRANSAFEADRIAFYVGDEMKFNRLRVDVGLRQEWFRGVINVERTATFANPNTTSLADARFAWGTGKFINRIVTFNDFSYVLGLNYELSKNTNLYGSFTKGVYFPEMRTFGNVNLDGKGNFIQAAPTQNENVYQTEVGAKYGSEKLSGTLAGYYINIKNRLQNDVYLGSDGVIREITNAVGSTTTMGIEASLAYKLTKGLVADMNLTLQDHQYDDFVKNLPGADGRLGTSDDTKIDYKGNWVLRQPKFMLNGGLTYDHKGWEAGINALYTGKRFADDQNNVVLPAYSLVNLQASRQVSLGNGQSVSLGFNLYNALNSRGLTEGDPRVADTSTLKNDPFYNARAILPRRLMLSVTMKF